LDIWRCGRRWSLCWSSDVEYCTMQHSLTLCFIIGMCVCERQSELFQVGASSVTTLTVISSFNSASRRSVAISGETDTSLVSKIADVVRGRSPSCSALSISSVAKPDHETSSSVASLVHPIESKRLVAMNTGDHLMNSSWSMMICQ